MSNVIPMSPRDPKIAFEAKQELDDALYSLAESVKLFTMAGRPESARCVTAHMNAIRTIRLMS